MSNKRGWIGVDFDGTLAHYDEWRGADHVGAPLTPMLARVRMWLAEGREVRIFTARVTERAGGEHNIARAAIEQFCLEHFGRKLKVTNIKDYACVAIYDDRAVGVKSNVGTLLSEEIRLA
jgi:hypothetical protein